MREIQLNLIYRILNEGQADSLVEVLKFFSESGSVRDAVIEDAYGPYRFHNGQRLYFKTLEEMGKFALEVCRDLSAKEVFVLSTVDYNLGIEAGGDAKDFREMFRRYGSVIENPDQSRKKNNIFNKLFN